MGEYYDLQELRELLRKDIKKELGRLHHHRKMITANRPHLKENERRRENGHTKTQHILPELPQVVIDSKSGKRYFRGRLLGKGGFARCYEVTDTQTDKQYACKAISKARISKPHQKEKIVNEVELHKILQHRFIVAFHGYFEDENNVYILLELCSRKSLVQLLKQRRTLTEPEVRYFMHQAIKGMAYLHERNVVHRDIKLGNLFVNHDMEIRIGDFGLAVKIEDENRKEMSVCGTPNYIAPEVLNKGGHSYEVDTWALGCVMYTLLVGRPPFETSCLKDTYCRIRNNEYAIPCRVSRTAAKLIQKLLSDKPESRPLLGSVLQDDFFTKGYFPRSLPPICCVAPPKFSASNSINAKFPKKLKTGHRAMPNEANLQSLSDVFSTVKLNEDKKLFAIEDKARKDSTESGVESQSNEDEIIESFDEESSEGYFSPQPLYYRLAACLDAMPDANSSARSDPISAGNSDSEDEHNLLESDIHGEMAKKVWVTKWVDYSNKYGFGAQLSNGCIVIRFNDRTTLAIASNKRRLQYFDEERNLFRFSVTNIPDDLSRKVTLLNYFGNYMDKHLLKGGDLSDASLEEDQSEIPIIDTWFRTEKAMVMYLSDGTLQVNFLSDHTKIILTPDIQRDYVTYINRTRQSTTSILASVAKRGCRDELAERLQYSRLVLQKLNEIYFECEK